MNLGKIENEVWVSNDRTLIENYYTLLYFKKFITDKEYYIKDLNNLSKYYIPVMKGMLNRCIRQDQKDWKFVYICFGFTSGTSSIHTIVRYIEQMERNLNYYKIADDRFEYISEKQEMYINKLLKKNFNRSIENALIRILDEIYKRNLEEYTKMSLDEFIYSEFATKVNFSKINYNLVFGGIGNVEEGMYIKDRLHNVTPGTRRSFYKRLLKVAKTNEELDEIRTNITKEGISIIVPNSVDHVIINRYKNLNDENINNYFEKYNSFEEAWENRSEFIDKEDETKLKFFGSILLKVDNKQQLNLVKNEMNYYEIKRQRNDKYNKLLYHINNSQSLDSAIEVKNIMYKEGLLVGLKVYHTIIDKFQDVEGIDKVIDEMNLLLEDEICYKNLLDDIDQAESFEECMSLKRAALENGVVINEKIYGAILYKAKDTEQINLIMEEMAKQNIILKSLEPREYINFRKIPTFEKKLDSIKRYYFNGKLVDIKMYLMALNKIENSQDVEYIKNQIKFRFSNDDIEIKNNKDMMKIMLINDDLNEILKYKKKLEDGGKRLNRKCYNEILYKCRTYEDAQRLLKEKLQNGYDVEYSNYLNLIGLSNDFIQAKQLKDEMRDYGIECDIKIYQKLIKKCNSGKEIIKILIEMVELSIPIDDKLIELAITKADNLDQVRQIKAFYV